jgi:uncharacterized membrane protein YhhN
MCVSSLTRYGRTCFTSFAAALTGSALFFMSYSILAINKFLIPFSFTGFLVMVTYCEAQFLIVTGLIHHDQAEK